MRIRIPIARCRLRPRLQIATRPVASAAVRAPRTVGLLILALVAGAWSSTAADVTVARLPQTATTTPATTAPGRTTTSSAGTPGPRSTTPGTTTSAGTL